MSTVSGSTFDQGMAISQSRYVRVMEYSAEESGMRSKRLSSRCACSRTSARHARVLDRLLQLFEFGRGGVGFTQFLLDLLQSLAQNRLLLPLVERLAGAFVDLARHLQHLDAAVEEGEYA